MGELKQSFSNGGGALPQGFVSYPPQSIPATPRPRARQSTVREPDPAIEESVIQWLLCTGFLAESPATWNDDPAVITHDLDHVRDMFTTQVPDATVHGVYRIKHDGHSILYRAVQDTMDCKKECTLWHGTSADCVRNIALNGFNRNYCGRHGVKFGHGTYFSSSANYSLRFCDRKASRRFMFLAKVVVGMWTKGEPDLREPPFRDGEGLMRYDSTVDDVEAPKIFCVFRDFQALPLYVLEFSTPS
jgi:hypothetical protein